MVMPRIRLLPSFFKSWSLLPSLDLISLLAAASFGTKVESGSATTSLCNSVSFLPCMTALWVGIPDFQSLTVETRGFLLGGA
jgi:hypothetical protein